MTKVFVYGTLKRGKYNHYYLAGSELITTNYTIKGYKLFVSKGLPFLKRDDNSEVVGEVYEVDDKALVNVRELEHGYTEHVNREGIIFYSLPDASHYYDWWITEESIKEIKVF